jgi:hypothetical protein
MPYTLGCGLIKFVYFKKKVILLKFELHTPYNINAIIFNLIFLDKKNYKNKKTNIQKYFITFICIYMSYSKKKKLYQLM